MTIKIVSLFLLVFISILLVWGILKIHTYPEKVAKQKNHPQTRAIAVTSVLGLLIFPLWMLALVWAYSNAVLGNLYTTDGEEKKPLKQSDPDDNVDKGSPTDSGVSNSTDMEASSSTNQGSKNNN